MTARTTRGMLIRSLLEGVTYGMKDALTIMEGMGIPVSQVRASGGGARSDFWLQLQADIYRQPIVSTSAAEGPAYGVAILAGVGTGVWSGVEEAARSCVKCVRRRKPNGKTEGVYGRGYGVYGKLYGNLRERFGEMAGV